MTSRADTRNSRVLGAVLPAAIMTGAVADDAGILANFVGIAPQVEGPILHLNARSRTLT
jgi:hypothetical protein